MAGIIHGGACGAPARSQRRAWHAQWLCSLGREGGVSESSGNVFSLVRPRELDALTLDNPSILSYRNVTYISRPSSLIPKMRLLNSLRPITPTARPSLKFFMNITLHLVGIVCGPKLSSTDRV